MCVYMCVRNKGITDYIKILEILIPGVNNYGKKTETVCFDNFRTSNLYPLVRTDEGFWYCSGPDDCIGR